jgi:DNA-binding MarR family transcriptional regulator
MGRLTTSVRRRPATTPSELAGRLRLSMIHLSRQLRHREPSEHTIAQLSALSSVERAGPLSVGQLAELEGLPSPAATRLADKLEQAGLVERRANPEDRRGVHLVATARGNELLARRAEVGTTWLAERLAALSESDRRALERAVAVLEALAAERLGETPKESPRLKDDTSGHGRAWKGAER